MRLWLSVLAYNLGNLWRRLELPAGIDTLVADQLAAAAGENRRTARLICALLLVAAGRGASDAAAVCRHAAEDRGAAVVGGITRAQSGADFDYGWRRREKCLRNGSEKRHLRALRAHQMRNRPLAAPLETP